MPQCSLRPSSHSQRGLGEVLAQPIHPCSVQSMWNLVAGAEPAGCQGGDSKTATGSLLLSSSKAIPSLFIPCSTSAVYAYGFRYQHMAECL